MKRKFVILSTGRTGSTYVVGGLRRHPQIHMASEILGPRSPSPINGAAWEPGSDALAFVNAHLYDSAAIEKPVRGFKLFYFHARNTPAARTIWTEIAGNDAIAIITLHRRNRFAGFVSSVRAKAGKVWHPKSDDDSYHERRDVAIDTAELERWLDRTEGQFAEGEALRRDREGLAIFYEDLVADAGATLDRVVAFLGCEPDRVAWPDFLPGGASHAQTRLTNLAEIERTLAARELSWMLDPYRPLT